MDNFFAQKQCCRNRPFGDKIFKRYHGDKDACKSDPDFADFISLYVVSHRYTNMAMERLLALIRRWCSTDHAEAERLAACGLLGQALTAHTGDDPRAPTRQQLLQDGVALHCAKPCVEPKQCGTFVRWLREQSNNRDAKQNRAEFDEWRRNKVREWHALEDERKAIELHSARHDHLSRLASQSDEPPPKVQRKALLETVVSSIGSDRTPFRADVFEKIVKEACGVSVQSKPPGFSQYSDLLRQRQLDRIFVPDSQSVPRNKTMTDRVPCPLAHPSLCAEVHAWCLPQVKACVASVWKHLEKYREGTFWHVRVLGRDDYHTFSWFQLSYTRHAGPRLNMVSQPCLTKVLLCFGRPISSEGTIMLWQSPFSASSFWRLGGSI